MARFLPKEITDRLLQQDQSLGGSLQNATVLFSDIRRFTGFSERNGPQETVRMLNAYFSVMYEQITDYNGILDKYIGDAIMAVFGVPFSNEMDANNAVHAAIQMMAELKRFNEMRKDTDFEPIEIGIGINTDEVVCGNIGSEKRMDFTVIGDGVNLAARLEGATKVYKTPVLISHQTKVALTEKFEMRELDYIRVKGKDMPVPIYELLEVMDNDKRLKIVETLPHFKKGMGLYREQQWEEAISSFNAVLDVVEDQVSQLYISRCKNFITLPPDENWNGAWDLLTK
jgi:adenylate cyclase